MACYGPVTAWYSKEVNPETGKRSLVFQKNLSHSGIPLTIPCGQCIGCRIDRSRGWAARIIHEKRLHTESAFVTLTYADKNLPKHHSLVLPDLQKFMKRLRKERPQGIRFYACGEYGETTARPHYHVLLLNTCFPDMRQWGPSKSGETIYTSKELETLWPLGNHKIGAVTYASAAYCASYVLKKINGAKAPAHYGKRTPEFTTMSRRPGLGTAWYDKYKKEAYDHDTVIMNARETSIPRFYDLKMAKENPELIKQLKKKRKLKALANPGEQTKARLWTREQFAILTRQRFSRDVS